MRSILMRAVLIVCLGFGSAISVEGRSGQSFGTDTDPLNEPGKIVVKFKPAVVEKGVERFTATGISSLDERMARFSVQEVRKRFRHRPIPEGSGLPDLSRIYTLTFPQRHDPVVVAREFAKDPNIEYAEPIVVPVVDESPNDPLFAQQSYLDVIQAVQAWDVQHGDSTVVIAINDNGTDWEHPDLHDNMWTNEVEANGIPGVDDDGNGYMDDIRGYDLAEDDNDPTNAPQDPLGYWMHGTHTGGIAAAVTNNGVGVAGMSWNCEIMPIKASYDESPRYVSFGYQGIIYAAENGADVVSNSWGSASNFSQANQDVINYAYGLGTIVVCSGGNSGLEEFHYPSGYVNALSVCWVNNSDAQVGTYGISIDVCAPGSNILNTYPDNTYDRAGGSSMSCPLAAGLCGLVKSQHPEWSNDRIVRQVVLTADDIDSNNPGLEGLLGSGRINAFSAVTATELTDVQAKIRNFDVTVTDEVSGDGDGLLERGETINVYARYRNYSLGTTTNFDVTLMTEDPDLTVMDGTSFVGTFPPDTFCTTSDPLAISIAADADPHMAQLSIAYTADGGISGADTFSIIVGKMPVLLVDDDDGQNNVEGYYTSVFDDLGILYAVWDHVNQGSPTPFILSNFPIVVWSCEWTFPSLDADDRIALEDYLNNGGNLFISGQDIGWDFNEGDRAEFVNFFETYLHAIYYADNSGVQTIDGITGDEIGDGLGFDIYQPGRDPDQQYPDEIEPGPGASAVFEYAGGRHHKGGIKYAGDHRVIYFSFGFEAIDASPVLDPTAYSGIRSEVMTRVLDWVNFIWHEPLKDSEDLDVSIPVEVKVTGDVSDLTAVTLFWKKTESPSFSQLSMTHQGEGVYTAVIPAAGSEATISYYFTTENPYYEWQSPIGAPTNVYTFHVQADASPPEIVRVDQIFDTAQRSGSAEVSAKVTDNVGIDEVTLFYRTGEEPFTSVPMSPTGIIDEYQGALSWSGEYGDQIEYYVEAVDASSNHNSATSATVSFQIVPYQLVDDFETGTDGWDVGTGWGLGGFGVNMSTSITDSPEGAYGDNEDNALTYEGTFDLSTCEDGAMTFWHFYAFEQGNDFGYVEISTDGENWSPVESFTGNLPFPMSKQCVLLNSFCGPGNESLQFRFRVVSNESETADGWTIDDVTLVFQVDVGDINCDGVINIIDVIGTVNVVLGLNTSSYAQWAADFNEDGQVNIIDAIVLVNWILSNPKLGALDVAD